MKKTVHGAARPSDVAVPHITPQPSPWAAKLRRPVWTEAAIRCTPQAVADEGNPDTPPTESPAAVSHVGLRGLLAFIGDLVGLLIVLWMLFLMWRACE